MGVPQKMQSPTSLQSLQRVNSAFCEISSNLSYKKEEVVEGSYKVYNLGVEDYPDLEGQAGGIHGYYIIMDVGEPVTITTKESFFTSTFTTYLIRVETNFPTFCNAFSTVRRRYTEFCWLRDELIRNHPHSRVPPLPPKKFCSFMNFTASVIQQRLKGLTTFLQRVLDTPTFLRDQSLLLFLQSDLTVQEMEEVKGHPSLVAPLIPLATDDNLLIRQQSVSEDEEENVEEEESEEDGEKSVESEGSQSGCGSSARVKRLVEGIPIPAPIPNCRVFYESDKLCTSSSEGDSGHFEASSSTSTSPNNKLASTTIFQEPRPNCSQKWKTVTEEDFITATPSSQLNDHFMLFSPAISYYVMQ